jgi:60 kDa SS-A/Ro ribonucleoprotein
MVPNGWLQHPEVWGALLHSMPITAMIRNLGKMSEVGLLTPMSDATQTVISRLTTLEYLRKARIHPFNLLVALLTYKSGHGVKGSLQWKPVSKIVDALDKAFYLSFQTVEPTGKRIMIALDVSGSMHWGLLGGVAPGLSAATAAAAMAMVTERVESRVAVYGFGGHFTPLDISGDQRLDDVVKYMAKQSFGHTDCALPMLYAHKERMDIDAFLVYTDNETWYGKVHPFEALRRYRDSSGITARLVVAGMTATDFTIADPADPGMLDVVGFDASAPQLISEFVAGAL